MKAQSLAMLAAIATMGAALGGEELKLEQAWKVQPATSSSVQPDPKDWGVAASSDWRWGVNAKNASWAKKDRKEINSFWCEQSVKIPAEWAGKRLFLDFRRIEGDAIVFVNGAKIGELLRPGGEIEISGFAKPGEENQIRVFVTRDYTDISRKFEQDRIRYVCRTHEFGSIPMERWGLGLSAPVTLLARPQPAAIAGEFIQTSFREKEIKIDVDLDASAPVKGLSLRAEIFAQDGKKALSFEGKPFSLKEGKSTASLSSKWADPVLWELDGGYLYTAKLTLLQDGKAVDEAAPEAFGFREIWADGRKLMLNGHEARLRMVLHLFSGTNALNFMRLMGFNASYVQANPTMWWRDWNETPVFDQQLIDDSDKAGYALLLPAPGVSYVREALVSDEALRKDFERETALHLRPYRNNPSVIAWCVGMNSYNPRDAISPQGMGRRYEGDRIKSGQPKAILAARDIVREFDKTRLVYSHADGNLGDLASANMYLNFAQLQEREEWPQLWSQSGDMPYHMAEFGQPYTANFWKGKRFLPTEYLAMYFGQDAYKAEAEASLAKVLDYGLDNKSGHGAYVDWNDFPLYWEFQRLFVNNTNRAFRLWGVNGGWAYWLFDGYGDPTGFDPKQSRASYKRYYPLKEAVSARPSWASPNFDIYSQANKPLLACLAGWPVHTDKTHVFLPGEKVEKSAAIVWDGPGSADLALSWELKGSDLKGSLSAKLGPGETKLLPISFNAPASSERKDFDLTLSGTLNGKPIEGDKLQLTVIPAPRKLALKSKVGIFDPAGKSSAWLKALGVEGVALKEGAKLDGIDLLIVGREALKPGDKMPFGADDVKRGLKALVLEQKPEVWRGLGFRSNEAMPRRVFVNDASSPVFKGLEASDLVNWRGKPDLLPEGKNQPAETLHAPKWTNTHGVVSSMPQAPRAAGFTPLAVAEFDLDYSPLLEWRHGKGLVDFCALDLTGRVGSEPAATLLASNLLSQLDAAAPQALRQVALSGGKDSLQLLKSLCVEPVEWSKGLAPSSTLLVVGSDSALDPKEIESFAKAGGKVLLLPQSAERLAQFGFKSERKKLQKAALPDASDPLFRGIGPNLLRWRAPIEADCLPGGVLEKKALGEGALVFCQVSPDAVAKLFPADKDKAAAVDSSLWRSQQLVARLLTNLGAEVSQAGAERLCFLDLGPRFEVLNHWNVLGPFFVEKENPELMLSTKFPGEDSAIAGDNNPNPTFKTSDGRVLDWRPTVKAEESGFVNLAKALKRESLSVAYVIAYVQSESEREAVLRLGFDWRARVWVNGEEVFKTLSGGNKAGAYSVRIKLKKGENAISMKIASGSKGHGFFADLSKELPAGAKDLSPEMKAVSFYAGSPLSDEFDPYEFHYW